MWVFVLHIPGWQKSKNKQNILPLQNLQQAKKKEQI